MMKVNKYLFLILILIFISCSSNKYVKRESVNQRIITIEGDSFDIVETYVMINDSMINYHEGPYMEFYKNGNCKLFGYQSSIIYPLKSTDKIKYWDPVKKGRWYYFNKSGTVDSIVEYKKVQDIILKTDTIFTKNNRLAIDSIYMPIYSKNMIYAR